MVYDITTYGGLSGFKSAIKGMKGLFRIVVTEELGEWEVEVVERDGLPDLVRMGISVGMDFRRHMEERRIEGGDSRWN